MSDLSPDAVREADYEIVAEGMYQVPGKVLLEYREMKRTSRSGPSDRQVERAAQVLAGNAWTWEQWMKESLAFRRPYLDQARAVLVAAGEVGEE